MARVKSLIYSCLLVFTLTRIIQGDKRRPLAFVLCLKGFRWDLPHYFSSLPHLRQMSRTGSTALWVESEFGGSQTNILSLMSGLHVEAHARHDFIETIPVLNEHVGGHTRLFYWPWFDQNLNQSSYSHLLSGRKGQPEIIEPYTTNGRMSLQRLQRSLTSMLDSLIDENDRTNLVMAFIDEPFSTMSRHEIYTESVRRLMISIDRLLGRLLTVASNNNINLIVLGDHGIEPIDCRQPIHLDNIFNTYTLNEYTHRYSGTSLSFVLYPKTGKLFKRHEFLMIKFCFVEEYAHRLLVSQLQHLPETQVQIYSKDHDHLPPKLRLPTIPGQPSPIILFPKAQYYFAYNKEPTSILCASQSMIDCRRTGTFVSFLLLIDRCGLKLLL